MKVQVYVLISGDYVSYSELSIQVMYDLTNGIQLKDMTLDDIQKDNSSEINILDAVLVDDKYYISLDKF